MRAPLLLASFLSTASARLLGDAVAGLVAPTCKAGPECVDDATATKKCLDENGKVCYDRFTCALQSVPVQNDPGSVFCFDRQLKSCAVEYCNSYTSVLLPSNDDAGCCSGMRCNLSTSRCFIPSVAKGCIETTCEADSDCCDGSRCNRATGMCFSPYTDASGTCSQPTCLKTNTECCEGYSCNAVSQSCFRASDASCSQPSCETLDAECCQGHRCAPMEKVCFDPQISAGCMQKTCSASDLECCDGHRCNPKSMTCFDPAMKEGCDLMACVESNSECCTGFFCRSTDGMCVSGATETHNTPAPAAPRAVKPGGATPSTIPVGGSTPQASASNQGATANAASAGDDGSGGSGTSGDMTMYIGIACGAVAVLGMTGIWFRQVRKNKREKAAGAWDKIPPPTLYS